MENFVKKIRANISHTIMVNIMVLFIFSCQCLRIPCGTNDSCPQGLMCFNGCCVSPLEEPCDDVNCPEGWECYARTCFEMFNPEENCPEGTIYSLDERDCVPDPCHDITCPEGYDCLRGTCILEGTCENVFCPEGYECYLGECFEPVIEFNPCGLVNCPEDEICYNGVCYNLELNGKPEDYDNCFPKTCPFGWVCEDGECKPLDQRWHEAIIIGEPWFILEGVVLDNNRTPLSGVDIFVQNRLTPFKSNDKGQFSVLLKKSQIIKLSYSKEKNIQFIANPYKEKILIQFEW